MKPIKTTEARQAVIDLLKANPQGMTSSEIAAVICVPCSVSKLAVVSVLDRMARICVLSIDRSMPKNHRYFLATDDCPFSDNVIQRTVPAKRRKCKLTTKYSPMGWCVAALTGAM